MPSGSGQRPGALPDIICLPEQQTTNFFHCSDGRDSQQLRPVRRSAARVEQGDLFKFYCHSRSLISAHLWYLKVGKMIYGLSNQVHPVKSLYITTFQWFLKVLVAIHCCVEVLQPGCAFGNLPDTTAVPWSQCPCTLSSFCIQPPFT